MDKLWLIIKREYLSRVTNKTFLLTTLLVPIGMGLLMFVSGYLAKDSMTVAKKVIIKDNSGFLKAEDFSKSTIDYKLSQKDLENLKDSYVEDGYDMLVVIPEITDLAKEDVEGLFFSDEKQSLVTLDRIESRITKSIKRHKLENSGIPIEKINALKVSTTLENAIITDGEDSKSEGDATSRSGMAISMALSGIMGFMMYMVVTLFGSMVMRSVMEEKINRIVEVMISTVKPIHLMMGKIIGVGFVGLTQLLIWLILIPLIMMGIGIVFGGEIDMMQTSAQTQEAMAVAKEMGNDNMILSAINEIKSMNWMLIIPTFIVFFLGGYFIYSSLFAAVGSAMGDDMAEGQQMMLPIMLPIIMSLMMLQVVINDPNGKLAVIGSIFPLTSPILMPARLPFEPPLWQVALSAVVLILSIILFAWIAGKIYRVGILMYGKKTSFKEIAKWITK